MTTKKKPEINPLLSAEKDASQDEIYKPMAIQEPTTFERLTALELRMTELERTVSQHNRYHFGGRT